MTFALQQPEMLKTITEPQLCETFSIMAMFTEKFQVVRQMHNIKTIA